MKIPIGDMKVMIPLDSVEQVGLREVIDSEGVKQVFTILQQDHSKMSSNWNRRYRANMEKIKSGDIFQVAEVFRNLMYREKEKGLSTGERKMLDSAKQILVSELVLAQEKSEEDVDEILNRLLADVS
jgi:CarD family transcriptional regulator